MSIFIKILLVVLAVIIAIIFYPIWMYYLKPDPKPTVNFVGMTRVEVLEWLEKNAKNYEDPKTGEMKFKISPPSGIWFSSKEEVLNDSYFMTLEEWKIGHFRVYRGRISFYFVEFKNDVVIRQYSGSQRS